MIKISGDMTALAECNSQCVFLAFVCSVFLTNFRRKIHSLNDENKIMESPCICISKTKCINIQICLGLKERACRHYRAAAPGWLTGNMAPATELSAKTIQRIINLLSEGNSAQSDRASWSASSKAWTDIYWEIYYTIYIYDFIKSSISAVG